MKERPILFSTEMVNAILYGRKTHTRRVLKYQADARVLEFGHDWEVKEFIAQCKFGRPGDFLWVRETWNEEPGLFGHTPWPVKFRADGYAADAEIIWKPSIFMKKIHARVWLQIESVHVEQLQDIK